MREFKLLPTEIWGTGETGIWKKLITNFVRYIIYEILLGWLIEGEWNDRYIINVEEEPTRCYLLFYYTYDRLNMFRAPLCPSSGAHDYNANYHLCRLDRRLLMVGGLLQAGWLGVRIEGYCLQSGNRLTKCSVWRLLPSILTLSQPACT
jgi:hypothetical protein